MVALTALGWAALGLMAADADIWLALCQPLGAGGGCELALVFAMWAAMTLAMMLPTAAPMILTYAEIADTAARKGEPAASPLLLTAGYVAVWLGFAFAATALQFALTQFALLDAGRASPWLAGAIFLGAGLYQFSTLKHACLTLCQRPFPFFFANWTAEPRGVFRLGLAAGTALPRLLLGDDAGDVRRRRDERGLDGGAGHGDDDREDDNHDAVLPGRRHRVRRDRAWRRRNGIGALTCR